MGNARFNVSFIVSALAIVAVMIAVALTGDYFFDLNDDVLMKDILSGAYTGVPEGHNIQMLYLISLFISLPYRIGIEADWYGIFLCFCQYFCLFIILFRTIRKTESITKKIALAVIEVLVILGLFLPHLLFVQYTVICGLMSATAAFLIITPYDEALEKRENILAVVLLIIAFLIRSEMLLLTLPLVGVAILIRWGLKIYALEDYKAHIDEIKKYTAHYLVLCFAIVAGMILCIVTHKMAYSSDDWKEFTRFFDNRTELYDFQYIPDYDENADFYNSIGLSKAEYQLLVNYNFSLDDEINADTLLAVAEYADSVKGEETPLFTKLKQAVSLYFYRLHQFSKPKSYEYPMTDYPWNLAAIILYIAVIAVFAIEKEKKQPLLIPAALVITLFACRSVLWLFIIFRGRDPIRITHPLYLMEILILIGIIFSISSKKGTEKAIFSLLIAILGISAIPSQIKISKNEQSLREECLENYRALYEYFENHQDDFYFIDVYTSVSYADEVEQNVATYSEKMFENVNNSCYNHDILGGWAAKSPLSSRKLAKAGYKNVQDALISQNVFFVQNKSKDTQWLYDYYKDKGIEISIIKIDEIANLFAVYSVQEAN